MSPEVARNHQLCGTLKTYSDLEELSTIIEPGEKLSQAKTVETMVKNFKSLLTNEEVTNENRNQKKEIHKR